MTDAQLSEEPLREWLQQAPFFRDLSAAQRQEVVQAARRQKFERDSFLFQQGDPASSLYLLLTGRLRILQVTPDGQQVLLRVITPGETFGGIVVLDHADYPASARAVEDCAVLVWDRETLARLMEHCPRLALNALQVLADRIQSLQDQYRELATERVERRLARALLRLTRQTGRRVEAGVLIDFPLSREDLAEMTGATLFTVSRILSGWEREGLIKTDRQRILIRFPHGLVAIAEDLPASPAPLETAGLFR
ncbi:MAG: Crp/Fnr family transcriptional regulator [Caldilineales bacterium]|nr:Crp/Fnr family transcriptional regulator [Caldilineales bacterium]